MFRRGERQATSLVYVQTEEILLHKLLFLDGILLFMVELDIESKTVDYLELKHLLLRRIIDGTFWFHWPDCLYLRAGRCTDSFRVHLISAISTGLTCQLLIFILISLHTLHLFKNKCITRRMSTKAKLWYICTVGKDVVVASGILFVYC